MAGDDSLGARPAREVFDLTDDTREIEGREVVLGLFDGDECERGQRHGIWLESVSCGVNSDPAFHIESCRCHCKVKQRTLPVAQVVNSALPACLIRTEDNLDLSDKFLESKIDRPEERSRVRAGGVYFLP